jgi:hypothetical protein
LLRSQHVLLWKIYLSCKAIQNNIFINFKFVAFVRILTNKDNIELS